MLNSAFSIVISVGMLGAALLSAGVPQAVAQPVDRTRAVADAIARATPALLERRRRDGSWAGDIIMASRHTAFHVIVSNYVGYHDQPYYGRALEWLIKNQSPEGTWGRWSRRSRSAFRTPQLARWPLRWLAYQHMIPGLSALASM